MSNEEAGARAERMQPVIASIFGEGQAALANARLQLALLEVSWIEHRGMSRSTLPGAHGVKARLLDTLVQLWPWRRTVMVTIRLVEGGGGEPQAAISALPATKHSFFDARSWKWPGSEFARRRT